ncbi:unnamed protein product [Gemmata massiliana]|uniref:Uncharacterized protein n=1 Tax=Gemmata massiliana TaxID=1210884 RepID=A0A6P2D504_9BACT|nr:hypothetical protein [Gemmata massiliana]VTR95164.1 unnamed protein product [Gemmata massiliana]
MIPSVLPHSIDPADGTPEERARTVAALLAAGLLRLRGASMCLGTASTPEPQELSESLPNELALSKQKSATVSAG